MIKDRETRDRIRGEVARACGVLMTLYGLVRDTQVGAMVDADQDGFFGSVIADTVAGLQLIGDLIDEDDMIGVKEGESGGVT